MTKPTTPATWLTLSKPPNNGTGRLDGIPSANVGSKSDRERGVRGQSKALERGRGGQGPTLFDDDSRRRAQRALARDFVPHARGDGAEDGGVRVAGIGDRDRMAGIRGLANRKIERHFTEEFGTELFGLAAGAAMRKDLAAAAAMRAQEIAHILDDAEYRHVDLFEHVETLARVEQCYVLRRRNDDRAGERHLLRHRQLGVAGPRRHVD